MDSLEHTLPEKDLFAINLNYLREIAGDDVPFMIELITLFLQQTPENLKKLKLHAQQQDWENLKKIAHKMRSSVALMGIEDLQQVLIKLQAIISEQINLELIPFMVSQVTEICQRALPEIKIKLGNLK